MGSRQGWDPGEMQLLSLQGLTNQCWQGYRYWCSDPVASCMAQLFEPLLFSFSSLFSLGVLFTPKPFFLSCLPLNLSLTDGDIEEEMCPLGILAYCHPLCLPYNNLDSIGHLVVLGVPLALEQMERV